MSSLSYPDEIGFAIIDVLTSDTVCVVGVYNDLDMGLGAAFNWFEEIEEYPIPLELSGNHNYQLMAGDLYGDGWGGQNIELYRVSDGAIIPEFEGGYSLPWIGAGGVDTVGFSTFVASCQGCMDVGATNFNPLAIYDNFNCDYYGCTDVMAANYDEIATIDDGSCFGCVNFSVDSFTDENGIEQCMPSPVLSTIDTICWSIQEPVIQRWKAPVGFELKFSLLQSGTSENVIGGASLDMVTRFYDSLNPDEGQLIYSCEDNCPGSGDVEVISTTGELSLVVEGQHFKGTCFEPELWYQCGPEYYYFSSGEDVIVELLALGPNLCGISVDDEMDLNQLHWNTDFYSEIDSIYVWKQASITGNWENIAMLSASSSPYTDSLSSPSTQPSAYRLSPQLNNPETVWGEYQQSSLLQSSLGIGGSVNLIWSEYVGVNVSSYRIWRRSEGVWDALIDLNGGVFNYIDVNPPPSSDLAYRIEVFSDDFCEDDGLVQFPSVNSNTSTPPQLPMSTDDTALSWIDVLSTNDKLCWSSVSQIESIVIFNVIGDAVYETNVVSSNGCVNYNEIDIPLGLCIVVIQGRLSSEMFKEKIIRIE